MSGWIAISRDLFDHGFFAREPMSEREAWVWMIARAAWKDTVHRVGSEVLPVPRGSFFCTLRELQQAWGWGSDKRVRNFLKRLENGRMADANATGSKTQITICNYDEFQQDGRSADASRNENGRSADALKEQGNNKQEQKKEPDGSLPKRARRCRLPPEWVPSDRNIDDAIARQFSAQDIDREATAYRDYHLAKGTLNADWDAAWRTWLGNARKFSAGRMAGNASPGGRGQGGSLASIAARRRFAGEG